MRARSLFIGSIFVLVGLVASCDGDSPDATSSSSPGRSDISSESESASAGEDTFDFEGETIESETIESKEVLLSGGYRISWEVSDNEFDSGGADGFSVYLIRAKDDYDYRISPYEAIDNGSGTKDIDDLKQGEYYFTVFAHPGASWSVHLERAK